MLFTIKTDVDGLQSCYELLIFSKYISVLVRLFNYNFGILHWTVTIRFCVLQGIRSEMGESVRISAESRQRLANGIEQAAKPRETSKPVCNSCE